MRSSLLFVASLFLLCVAVAQAQYNFKEVCNLSGDSWLPTFPTLCAPNNFTLLIPSSSRVQVVGGPYPSQCGIQYYSVYTFDMQAGFVDARNLCNIKSVFRGGDRVTPCKLPPGINGLSMYPTPILSGKAVASFPLGTSALVVSDPVYTAQRVYVSKVLYGSMIGYVQTDYVCLQ
ncbi:hypothetical protein C9374_005581 [Naegleria lovaniensis]|uniref:Uncharacterized protein n=1 Tax=Naegleria lovaniensis TaxID=51637 RepID=A0AA88GK01_NAELO|nr:uncharacterized protein C9374_005581 [Naegleria lovaniensis]KAG2382379.1 hypothetical protein C9374_005581 [Naegleria lovaniensis]